MKLEQIQIPKPCVPAPGVLRGSGATLFCSDCQKHVHDLSKMSREAGERLLAERGGQMCVQYDRDASGRVITREKLTRRQWMRAAVAATLAWGSIGLLSGGCRTRGAPVHAWSGLQRTADTPTTQKVPITIRGEMPDSLIRGSVPPPSTQEDKS